MIWSVSWYLRLGAAMPWFSEDRTQIIVVSAFRKCWPYGKGAKFLLIELISAHLFKLNSSCRARFYTK